MLKSEFRKIYLANQKALSPIERKRESELIGEILFRNFDFSRMRFLHCFLPIKKFKEVETSNIFRKVWHDFPQIKTLAPRVNFAIGEIENLIFTAETELVRNVWEICEPAGGETIETRVIDAVLVPLLCFDERGFRVGYGKGFYDKFLKNCRADCLKIGLSFFPPVEKIEDAQNFDVRLVYCVTPKKVFERG